MSSQSENSGSTNSAEYKITGSGTNRDVSFSFHAVAYWEILTYFLYHTRETIGALAITVQVSLILTLITTGMHTKLIHSACAIVLKTF